MEEIISKCWTDGCTHPPESYVGSINVYQRGEYHGYDVYVFTNFDRSEVCIRYGNEDHEYLSPGSLADFLMVVNTVKNEIYKDVCELILGKGFVMWNRRDRHR